MINPRKAAKSRECGMCGGVFTPPSHRQKYCSPECSELACWQQANRGKFRILERDGFRCVYCGRTSYEDAVKLHLDHIVPKSNGGADTAGNLVTACQDCNLEKRDRLLKEPEWILAELRERNRVFEIPAEGSISL